MTSVSSPTSPPAFPAMAPGPAERSLDPHTLIENSRGASSVWITTGRSGQPRINGWPVMFALVVMGFLWFSPGGPAKQAVAFVGVMACVVTMNVVTRRVVRRLAAEHEAVAALEELVQLRRWAEAADLAGRILGRPMLMPERRVGALLSLATILTRYHRFADARVVHEALLDPDDESGLPDPSILHAVRVARAMSLLREDLLVDADRAMGELRREVTMARDAVRRARGPEAANDVRSGGLALLDLYRDVKTGHAEEAIAIFERSISWLPDALGPRVSDAWVLVAAAYDRVGRADEARKAYANATSLTPAVELHRRWPETAALADRYAATKWPM